MKITAIGVYAPQNKSIKQVNSRSFEYTNLQRFTGATFNSSSSTFAQRAIRIQSIYENWVKMRQLKVKLKEKLCVELPYLKRKRVLNLNQEDIISKVDFEYRKNHRRLENIISEIQGCEGDAQEIKLITVEQMCLSDKDLNRVWKNAYHSSFKKLMKRRGLGYSKDAVSSLQFMDTRAEAKRSASLTAIEYMMGGCGENKIKV